MDDDSTLSALPYVLEQLTARERRQVDQRLDGDPAALAAVKDCADALTGFALETAAAPLVNDFERERILSEVLTAAASAAPRRPQRIWPRFVWPAAAALLLCLNLLELGKIRRLTRSDSSSATPASPYGSSRLDSARRTAAMGAGPRVDQFLDRIEDEQRKVDELRKDYVALLAARNAANKDYQKMLERFAAQISALAAGGRLSAIELLDNATYSAGAAKNSTGQSSPLLSSPGVVAASPAVKAPAPSAATPPTEESGIVSATGTTSGTTAATTSTASVTSVSTTAVNSITAEGTTVNLAPTGTAPSAASSAAPSAAQPDSAPSSAAAAPSSEATTPTSAASAYSVFDASAQQGFLDMYNMPAVTADQVLELWVQPVGSDAYVPVGAIPSQYYGNSGGIYYKLPDDNAIPSKILITVEAKGAAPNSPSGTVVVRGP